MEIRKNFEKDKKEFEKFQKSIWDLLALYSFISSEEDLYTFVGCHLMDTVLTDLESTSNENEMELWNLFNKGQHITEIFNYLDKKRNQLWDKYKESSVKEDAYALFYLNPYFYKEEKCYQQVKDKNNMHLLKKVFSKDWMQEVFASNISLSLKKQIFFELLHMVDAKANDKDRSAAIMASGIMKIFGSKASGLIRRSKTENFEKSKKELFQSFNQEDLYRIYECFIQISPGIICELQSKNFIDFNELLFQTEKGFVNICGEPSLSQTVNSMEIFYENISYKQLPQDVRDNTDLKIIDNLGVYNLPNFIGLSNFEITKEKLDKIFLKITSHFAYDMSYSHLLDMIKNIKLEIIKKAKNNKEYRNMLKYCTYLDEKVDSYIHMRNKQYNTLVALVNKEEAICLIENFSSEELDQKIIELKKQKELEINRSILTTVFYNLNEYAQENIPNRKLIKNAKFPKRKS